MEIFINGTWGTVCDDFWDDDNTIVVCRQLNLSTSGILCNYYISCINFLICTQHNVAVSQTSQFGSGSGAIFLDDVDCIGTENRLLDCQANFLGDHNCFHYEDVGIRCECKQYNNSHIPYEK